MWKKALIVLVVLSAALNIAFIAAWAVHAFAGRSVDIQCTPDGEEIWCPLHRKLGVTNEQWRQIEPKLRAFRDASLQQSRRVETLRDEMIALLAAPDASRPAIKAKQDEILAAQREMQDMMLDHLLAEKHVLTPEQQKLMFKLIRESAQCRQGPILGRIGN